MEVSNELQNILWLAYFLKCPDVIDQYPFLIHSGHLVTRFFKIFDLLIVQSMMASTITQPRSVG
jgi:hypothetical protein